MIKSSSNKSNKSAGMALTSSEGQNFIEVIYLNPQYLLKYHQNSKGKKIMFWRCMPVYSFTSALVLLYLDKLHLIVIDILLP